MALIDPSHPREKPCGGGVTGRALALVAGASTGRSLPSVPDPLGAIHRRRTVTARSTSRCPLERSARSSSRAARSSTARCSSAARARRRASPVVRACRCHVASTGGFDRRCRHGARLTASFVIGADGANSLVRRRVARAVSPRPAVDRDRLLRARRDQRRDRHRARRRSARLHLVVSAPDHLAIGICAQADAGVRRRVSCATRTAEWIQSTAIADGARLEPYSWPIPSLSRRRLRRRCDWPARGG